MTPLDWIMAAAALFALVGLVVCYTIDAWDRLNAPPQSGPLQHQEPLAAAPWWSNDEDREDDVQPEEPAAMYGLPNVYQKTYRQWLEEQDLHRIV
jgi:hypothetical protein